MIELQARTPEGRRLVALAEGLALEIGSRAARHDREGTFPHESIAALQAAGYLTAAVPETLGGLGVETVHDHLVASSRLARGDASVAIGVNMHTYVVLTLARRRRAALASGNERRARAFDASLRGVVRERTVFAGAVSEPGQDLTRPATTATRTGSGWVIEGRKVFCTMSPAATVLNTGVTFVDDRGRERYGYATVPANAPGVVLGDDWDALGMRASGSQSVTFDRVELPASALRGGFPVGAAAPYVERNLGSGLFHASAALGIAEAAHALAAEALARRNGHADGRARTLLADGAVDLSAARASLARGATLIDDLHAAHPAEDAPESELLEVFAEEQAAKAFVGDAASRVVDRALTLSGGAGYLGASPLARAYRDVRAVQFMHPLGANRAFELLAGNVLRHEPVLR